MIKRIFVIILALLWASFAYAATLLPNGEQTFFDATGVPLSSGSVYFYIPNTTAPKNTWKDPAQTTLNTNPVVLDAGGRAIIYGSGSYRQIVKDVNGNTIWDQLSSDTSASALSYGGVSTGSSSAQIVVGTNFSVQAGQTISFISGFTNTGPVTLSPDGGVTNYATVIDSALGPVPLKGGELLAGNNVFATFDNNGVFHLTPGSRSNPTASIASASTTDLSSTGVNYVVVTGTATISSFGNPQLVGQPFFDVLFLNGNTVITSSNIIMSGNITFNAGDYARFVYRGGGVWQLITYQSSSQTINATSINTTNITAANGAITNLATTNLRPSGTTYTGGAAADSLFGASAGSIVMSYGSLIRSNNIVSARTTFNSSGISNNLNIANFVNVSAGSYTFNFTQALNNVNYQVSATPAQGSAAPLCPIVGTKTTTGFNLTFVNCSSGAATVIGTGVSDIAILGGY